MSRPIVQVEGLGKQYTIGSAQAAYGSLRESVSEAVMAPLRRLRTRERTPIETIWALKDVNFEVMPGEVIGVVGRNGAGKSTLLKVLSRITDPTAGIVRLYGRVGSLLEVGTGFHPELTGRENIYLNGSILGMRRRELERKFDEIVEFSEIGKFLDTPVKRYSSGMYVRLAFAVAVHLEPEILIVDEVLAVGDAQFQKKCFTKMQEIGRGGRTILFVSHNMYAVRMMCTRTMVFEAGRLVDSGDSNETLDRYLARTCEDSDGVLSETPTFFVNDVRILSSDGPALKTFKPMEVRVTVTARKPVRDPGLYVGFLSLDNVRIAGLDFKDFTTVPPMREGETREMGFRIESVPFLPGSYQVELHLKDMASSTIEIVPRAYRFDILETPIYGGRRLDSWFGHVGLDAHAETFTSDENLSAESISSV